MTFAFRCPNCHSEHTAAASIAGRRVRCPDCFEIVTAVESDNVLDEPPRASNPTADTVVLSKRDISFENEGLDPYEQWLGIPPAEQPPNFYRLLELPAFEPDSYVISGAADRQIAKVRTVKDGQQDHLKERLIEEINRARHCLTDPEQRATYDRRLQKQVRKLKLAEEEQKAAKETTEAPERSKQTGTKAGTDLPPNAEQGLGKQPGQDVVRDEADTQQDAAVEKGAEATQRPAAASPPKVVPPPVVRTPPALSADLGVRALMHVDEEDEEDADAFVNFAEDRTEFESEMDMTPMVDVTFLLLIFFMVTASFSLQKSIEQPVQKEDEPSTNVTQQEFEDNPDYVVVQIDEFDTFRVITADFDEEAPSEQELLMKLRRARDGRGGRVPTKLLVAAHGEASHGRVVMALDAGTEVGMEQVQFTLAAEGDF